MKALPHGSRQGLTLVEAAIALTLLMVVLFGAANVMRQAQGAFETGRALTALQTKTHRTLHRIADHLVPAELGSLDPVPGEVLASTTLGYRHPIGVDDTDIEWGPTLQLRLELDSGEVDDGLDNDGDGLRDESNLVWRREPGTPQEVRVVWCRDVRRNLEGEEPNLIDDNGNGLIDERGLAFQLVGDVLTIRLSLESPVPGGAPLVTTAQTSVRIRN
jgi:hypothetical protein